MHARRPAHHRDRRPQPTRSAAPPRLLSALADQLGPGDEVVVVDNASSDGSADVAARNGARVVRNAENAGFAAACGQAVAEGTGELVVLLNPDCVPEAGFADAIAAPHGGGWDVWQGMVLDGDRVNTSGGIVHFTGLAWAGEAGRPAPARGAEAGREVGFASGACLAVSRASWTELGGFPAEFFMYHEDVDLSLRVRLAGGRVGVAPAARVDHDYDFAKGELKWRLLERNRWATIIRTYPGALLVLLAPMLAALELALVPASIAGGWGQAKAAASADVVRALPRLLRERRAIQRARRISPGAFAAGLTWEPSSDYLGALGRSRLLRSALRLYWGAVTAVLAP